MPETPNTPTNDSSRISDIMSGAGNGGNAAYSGPTRQVSSADVQKAGLDNPDQTVNVEGGAPGAGPQPVGSPAVPANAQIAENAVPPQELQRQQQEVLHHTAVGAGVKSVLKTLYGKDPGSKPGDIFKHILAGAIMGGAAGSEAPAAQRGSALIGAVRGGSAVIQDERKMLQVRREEEQRQIENQLKQKKDEREQKQLDSETQLQQAQIAHFNALTANVNVESMGKSIQWHRELAAEDKLSVLPYTEAGMRPVYDSIPESDMAELMKKRPDIGHTMEWYHTGTRFVPDKTGEGGHVEFLMSAYDPKGEVNVNKDVFKKWEKDGLYQTRPELKNLISGRDSYKMSAKEYAAINYLDRQQFADNLSRKKDEMSIEHMSTEDKHLVAESAELRARAAHEYAEAAKTKEDRKNGQLLSDAMTDLNKTGGDVTKLKPSSRYIIGQNAAKLASDATAEGNAILRDPNNFDENDKQQKAQQRYGEAEFWRNLARSPFVAPPPAAAGKGGAAAPAAGAAGASVSAPTAVNVDVDKYVKARQATNNAPSSYGELKIDPKLTTNSQRVEAATRLGITIPRSEIAAMAQAIKANPDEIAKQIEAKGGKIEPKPDWGDQPPAAK